MRNIYQEKKIPKRNNDMSPEQEFIMLEKFKTKGKIVTTTFPKVVMTVTQQNGSTPSSPQRQLDKFIHNHVSSLANTP